MIAGTEPEPTFADVPSRFRVALACAILHEYDPRRQWRPVEIAAVAGVTPNAVCNQLRGIMRRLRREADKRNIDREDLIA